MSFYHTLYTSFICICYTGNDDHATYHKRSSAILRRAIVMYWAEKGYVPIYLRYMYITIAPVLYTAMLGYSSCRYEVVESATYGVEMTGFGETESGSNSSSVHNSVYTCNTTDITLQALHILQNNDDYIDKDILYNIMISICNMNITCISRRFFQTPPSVYKQLYLRVE